MRSALYEGTIRHRRFTPVSHSFEHRVAMAAIDLAELEPGGALESLASRPRHALVRFDRGDYLGDPALPLDTAVRDLVEASGARRPNGPIVLLTQLRTAGWNFNPISLYYCYSGDGSRLEAVAFEVTNTPWGERHGYVVLPGASGRVAGERVVKQLHVSPFVAMDVDYRVSCATPAQRCNVRFELCLEGRRVLDADLRLRRAAPLDRSGIRRLVLRHPLMPMVVSTEIYFEALKLAVKRVPVYRHRSPRSDQLPPTRDPWGAGSDGAAERRSEEPAA
jgi:DUF1365 family protein